MEQLTKEELLNLKPGDRIQSQHYKLNLNIIKVGDKVKLDNIEQARKVCFDIDETSVDFTLLKEKVLTVKSKETPVYVHGKGFISVFRIEDVPGSPALDNRSNNARLGISEFLIPATGLKKI